MDRKYIGRAYSFRRSVSLEGIEELLRWLGTAHEASDPAVKRHLHSHIENLSRKSPNADMLKFYQTFLPPRIVAASRNGALIPFFGSGLSFSSGIPTWRGLIEELGLNSDFFTDPHVENDPLTQAELIAHDLGEDVLQGKLRQKLEFAKIPSTAHYLLAHLALPIYLTTNYDTLFEIAWETLKKSYGQGELRVIANDADIAKFGLNDIDEFPQSTESYLFKIHGCAKRNEEHLILTRTDYRRHYRTNNVFFNVLKGILKYGYVMFIGFGHRDPEVSRLVEDIIYDYEQAITVEPSGQRPPTLYSIQFDMRQKTPEVFAARGIVALKPATIIENLKPDEVRAVSLAVGLGELLIATQGNAHDKIELESVLRDFVIQLTTSFEQAMIALQEFTEPIASLLAKKGEDGDLQRYLDAALTRLGQFAGQGIYVTSSNGNILGLSLPEGLLKHERVKRKSFAERAYFRVARTFRRPFVSDLYPSVYNGNSTFFLCQPLGNFDRFEGLLFSAAQPGAWKLPVELRDGCPPGIEFVLVDGNGLAVVPPSIKFIPDNPAYCPDGEDKAANVGFSHDLVQQISKRDVHLSHIVQNVVPVGWDDDVHDVAPDLRIYSMVADIPPARWKLAVSRSIPSAFSTPK